MTPRVTHEASAGGVVLRRAGKTFEARLIRRGRHGKTVWCLPKGHLEPGEQAPGAAAREVEEETGIVPELLAPLSTIRYRFTAPGGKGQIAKTVTFFLMRPVRDADRPHDQDEVLETRWMPVGEAAKLLAYANERRLLDQACRYAERPAWAGRFDA